MNKIYIVLGLLLLTSLFVGCTRSASRVAYNLDYKAEEFQLTRRIVAINGITDSPIFEIVGDCSVETASSYVSGAMEITCKIGTDKYTKNFVYLSDNVLIVVEQIDAVDVPQYHYQINFAPQSILPIPVITGDQLGQ